MSLLVVMLKLRLILCDTWVFQLTLHVLSWNLQIHTMASKIRFRLASIYRYDIATSSILCIL